MPQCDILIETNSRGEKLEEFLADTGLEVENVGKEPMYESRGNSTRCLKDEND